MTIDLTSIANAVIALIAADPVEYALVDVIIDRLFADLRFEGQPQPLDFSDDGGGGIAFFADLLFDEGG